MLAENVFLTDHFHTQTIPTFFSWQALRNSIRKNIPRWNRVSTKAEVANEGAKVDRIGRPPTEAKRLHYFWRMHSNSTFSNEIFGARADNMVPNSNEKTAKWSLSSYWRQYILKNTGIFRRECSRPWNETSWLGLLSTWRQLFGRHQRTPKRTTHLLKGTGIPYFQQTSPQATVSLTQRTNYSIGLNGSS